MGLNFGYNGYEQPMVVNTYPPMGYGNFGGNGGFFGGNGGDWLGVLFLIALLGGGWGNGFGGNGGSNYNNLQEQMQEGFNHAATSSALAGLQTSVTTGFSNAEVANCNRAMDNMKATYDAQIANMQQNFSNIRDIDSRLDALASQFSTCCCKNEAAIADVKYTIANEAAATRLANAQGVQQIRDDLCRLEMDNYKAQLEQERRANLSLQNALNMATMRESQIAQTADLKAFIRPPINPSYPVQNPYACNTNPCTQCGNLISA